jgi:hypothetical protein
VRTALVKALQQYPGRLQRFLMDRVSRLLEESASQGIGIGPEAVLGLVSSALAGSAGSQRRERSLQRSAG